MPTANVDAVASENAWWIAETIAGTYGSTTPRALAGSAARIAAPMSPTPVICAMPAPPEPASALATCGGSPAAPRDAGSSRDSDDAKTVPVIASPTVPPTDWKNDRFDDATPMWRTSTLFWTIWGNTANVGPTPMPVTNIHAHTIGSGVSARSWVSIASPAAVMTSAPNSSQRYRPVRATTCPDTTAEKISPPSSGSIWYPETVADAPPTTWSQRGRNTIAAKNPNDARKTDATDTVNARFRNRPSGTIGSAARDSQSTNSARITRPTRIRPPTVTSSHSAACLLVSPTRMGTRAPVNSAAPT